MRRLGYTYEVGKDCRANLNKGHDRLVTAEDADSFAVFDGAGDKQASEQAARIFMRDCSRRCPPTLEETFKHIQHSLRRRHGAYVLRAVNQQVKERPMGYTAHRVARDTLGKHAVVGVTTGTAFRLAAGPDGLTFMHNHVHAGDSSLYVYADGQLAKITKNEGEPEPGNVDTNTSNFLGSKSHKLQQLGGLVLPEMATIALVTDGVNSRRIGGISDDRLATVLASDIPAQEKASSIIDASSFADDASAIVVGYQAAA